MSSNRQEQQRLLRVEVENGTRFPEIAYTFRLLGQCLGLRIESSIQSESDSDFLISYGSRAFCADKSRPISILESSFFGESYGTLRTVPVSAIPEVAGFRIPWFGQGMGVPSAPALLQEGAVWATVDIIAAAFFFASRYEEWLGDEADQFGRFPASASLAYRDGFLDRPVVNEYAELLLSWITHVKSNVEPEGRWIGHEFAACVTHDIDHLRKYGWLPPIRVPARHLLKDGKPGRAVREYVNYLSCMLGRQPDPFDTFEQLRGYARTHEFASTYFWMGGGRHRLDGTYTLSEQTARLELAHLKTGGHEIALHSSIAACDDQQLLGQERDHLEKVAEVTVSGVRQHFLMWKGRKSWTARQCSGLAYDASLGFPDAEGFRSGLCTPYHPFDFESRAEFSMWEVPLTVMDGTLRNYRGLSPEEAVQRIAELIETVKAYRGVFVLLWHNSSLDSLTWPGWNHVYRSALEELNLQSAWMSTISNMLDVWPSALPSSDIKVDHA